MIGCRTQLGNQIRGLLAEYGIILPLHLSQILPQLIAEEHPQLSPFARELFQSLYEELCARDRLHMARAYRYGEDLRAWVQADLAHDIERCDSTLVLRFLIQASLLRCLCENEMI